MPKLSALSASRYAPEIASDVSGAVNLASGRSVAIRDVVSTLGAISGRPELIDLGALPDRPGDPADLSADVARLRDEVGWAPTRALEDGLRETFEWWRARA